MDPNKAHVHDGVRTLKLSCPSIIKPLLIIFRNCLKFGTFPDDWKKGNVVPVHKKDNKQIVNNYHPVSLLTICSKIFEKLIILSSIQSDFKTNDSCVNQLISITHSIYSAFDANLSLEIRGVLLDLPKAFDRVTHKRLLYELKNSGIMVIFLI